MRAEKGRRLNNTAVRARVRFRVRVRVRVGVRVRVRVRVRVTQRAKPEAIMCAYSSAFGIPSCAHPMNNAMVRG